MMTDTGLAACRKEDRDLFFPNGEGLAYADQIATAKAVCAECPIAAQCREYALNHPEAGIWGGLTEGERRAIRRRNAEQMQAA